MNVERLHAIARAILDDLRTTKAETLLTQLVTALQEQVNQPTAPGPQQQVSSVRGKLEEALESSAGNEFSMTWQQTLAEIGAKELLGNRLKERIDETFARNQITPAVVLDEIKTISNEFASLKKTLEQLTSSLASLEIGKEDLESGECEVGVLVPRLFVANRVDKFGDELKELNKIFGVFSEIVTGSRPGFKIRSISSSELSVFLEVAIPVAACIALGVEKIISTYKNLLDIRRHHAELGKLGLGPENLEGIHDYADKLMQARIEEIDKELLNEFLKTSDRARKNELEIELRGSLTKIAKRIDRGFSIDVRVQPLLADNNEASDQPKSGKEAEYIAKIREASESLQYAKLEGEPILSLPEPPAEEIKPKATERKPKTTQDPADDMADRGNS